MAIHAPAQRGGVTAPPVHHHYLAWTIGVVAAIALVAGMLIVAPNVPSAPRTTALPITTVTRQGVPILSAQTGFAVGDVAAPSVVSPATGFVVAAPGMPVVNRSTGFTVGHVGP